MATHHVSTDAFTGPFDLLAHLVVRRQLDIYDVSLAGITDAYLEVLDAAAALDLDTTTEFLVIASQLAELKAARLLPSDRDEVDDQLGLEVRDLLYARLLDYRTFARGASWLGARIDAQAGFVPRDVELEPQLRRVRPPVELTLSAPDFAAVAVRALTPTPPPQLDLSHVAPVRITVGEAQELVRAQLNGDGTPLNFTDLAAGRPHIEVVVCFLALLELYKSGEVDLDQDAPWAPVRVTATTGRRPA